MQQGELSLNFDGGATPNPGGVPRYGWVIYSPTGETVAEGAGRMEKWVVGSNNEGEYAGLIAGLTHLKAAGWKGKLVIRGDSQLIVNQVRGDYACNKPHLIPLRDECRRLIDEVTTDCQILSVPREQNEKSDALAKLA